jgi:two-component system, OmpR family, sensor kinase
MSLRVRLTLFFTLTVGGILLLLGTAVYVTVSITLTREMDAALQRAVEMIISDARASKIGLMDQIILPVLDQDVDVYIQFWNSDGQLESSSVNLSDREKPLDNLGLSAVSPVLRNIYYGGTRWRVLTVPIKVSGQDRWVGTIQAGMNMAVVEQTQQVLLTVLVVGCLIAMFVSALAGWFSIRHALSPLEAVTETALRITRADDLSHRIPYSGPPDDEVGQLISAFNQTLGRLENLFNTQRRFIVDVGHELRTPLTVIKGNVDLMRRMNCTDEESMSGIEAEVDRLTRLVGDLLLLAQAESGKLPMVKRTVELDTILLEVLQQMRILAKDHLSLKLASVDQVLVCGDQDRLKQVIVNLVGNALKYTPPGGEVVVDLGKENDRAYLSVSDNGPGIPSEDIPHIFERFYRGEKSRTRSRDGKGFGLGLSIAYWIVRNHDGSITVTPREPKGTVFTVRLPLARGLCEDEKHG